MILDYWLTKGHDTIIITIIITVELQWLEYLWDFENMFETRGSSSLWVLIIAPAQ